MWIHLVHSHASLLSDYMERDVITRWLLFALIILSAVYEWSHGSVPSPTSLDTKHGASLLPLHPALLCVLWGSLMPLQVSPCTLLSRQTEFTPRAEYTTSSHFLCEHMTFLLWVLELEVIQHHQRIFISAVYEPESGLSLFITVFWCPGWKNSSAFFSSIAVYFIYSILVIYGFLYLLNSLVSFAWTNFRIPFFQL